MPEQQAGGSKSWICAACGTTNPLTSDICRSCNTSIYETFGGGEQARPAVEPAAAAVWGLVPGGGHFKVGESGLGLAVAGLIFSAMAFGALMAGGNKRFFGMFLLVVGIAAWAISIYDATRLAVQNDDAVLLRPRIITSAMGLVFAVVIVAAVSITGEGTRP